MARKNTSSKLSAMSSWLQQPFPWMKSPSIEMQEVQHPLCQGFTCIPKEEAFCWHVVPWKIRVELQRIRPPKLLLSKINSPTPGSSWRCSWF